MVLQVMDMFGKADANGNGLIEFDEFGPLWEQLAPNPQELPPPVPPPPAAADTAAGAGVGARTVSVPVREQLGDGARLGLGADAVARAAAKFAELDVDASNALEGEELRAMAVWVLTSFHPDIAAASAEDCELLTQKVMRRNDANGDGAMQFEEFVQWREAWLECVQNQPRSTTHWARLKHK